eukprot:Plantae.Rhodophyta-Rhodochaete_pulchella.ctg12119.p1 GENE.Plantae.Rhodophyta-Rhodochaete_pulchella.ctg12119~~Plantae.Rhodophyta-Rhodochaete_pulchella.ctg12119.p1  ORF type:complete len:246 (+),score=33.56 Plantae.Rhodophyta-Rhodochaete_pulchella.ctg12119:94-831(+)
MNSDEYTTPPRGDWIEVFYSRPSWPDCFVVYKAGDAEEFTPNGEHRLVDGSHVRQGFRVFRIRGVSSLQLAMTNGTSRQWDDNSGQYYHIEGSGRYVVAGLVRRVDDADAEECERSLRTNDKWIELYFEASLWDKCFCSYAPDDSAEWTDAPGEEMEKSPDTGEFFIRIPARKLIFAFTDGGQYWDSNSEQNYRVGFPGKYKVMDGKVHSRGLAEADIRGEPVPPKPTRPKPTNTAAGPAPAVAT